MRALVTTILLLTACGDDGATSDAGVDGRLDADETCQPLGATGQFIRRAGNPRLLPRQSFPDGKLDTDLADPDARWNTGAQRWEVFFGTRHATSFTSSDGVAVIRRATSADRMTWTVDDAPALTASAEIDAWDSIIAAPTVIENPDAPPDRRYLMLYAGANGSFPYMGYARPAYQIGAAFSADGTTFTRVPASASPHAKDGLVLTPAQVYPTADDGIVADPDVVLVDGVYHLFFSSFSCRGSNCGTVENMGVAHATSTDGITWNIVAAPVRSLLRATADTTSGGSRPSVIYDVARCRWELWLSNDLPADTTAQPVLLDNTAGVWRSSSLDGNSWDTINYAFTRELAWTASEPGEPLGMRAGVEVAANGSGRLMLFVGFDDTDVPAGSELPLRATGTTPGVPALNVATRDLP
ncbi:MAG TPA: hypothetical protein VM513_07175 [Kofleriaceae bacterium]|nr:hypothetical protein [Kofleriaceae bacterium]